MTVLSSDHLFQSLFVCTEETCQYKKDAMTLNAYAKVERETKTDRQTKRRIDRLWRQRDCGKIISHYLNAVGHREGQAQKIHVFVLVVSWQLLVLVFIYGKVD